MSRTPLWAPWRMEYVGSDHSGRCIFCEPEPAVADRERLILRRGSRAFVLLNRFPYAPGHLMVAPFDHCPSLHALDRETRAEVMEHVSQASAILEQAYGCEGLNVGLNLGASAGAGFAEHVHVHLVPRWNGDTNFMTVIGETRVMPQHLERIYDQLAPRFAELGTA